MMKSSTLFIVKQYNRESFFSQKLTEKINQKSAEKSADTGPSAQTLKNIFDFARAYEVVETDSAGDVEMILN